MGAYDTRTSLMEESPYSYLSHCSEESHLGPKAGSFACRSGHALAALVSLCVEYSREVRRAKGGRQALIASRIWPGLA